MLLMNLSLKTDLGLLSGHNHPQQPVPLGPQFEQLRHVLGRGVEIALVEDLGLVSVVSFIEDVGKHAGTVALHQI